VSGRLVSAVFDSALPGWLKPYGAALASFADDEGFRVYPSIKRIARMVVRSERQAQRAVTELRRLHILEVLAPSGRATATRYRFHAERLPLGGDGEQLPLSFGVLDFPQRKPVKAGLKTRFPQHAQQLTGHGCQGTPDTDVTRSVNRSVKYSTYTRARATRQTPKTGTEDV